MKNPPPHSVWKSKLAQLARTPVPTRLLRLLGIVLLSFVAGCLVAFCLLSHRQSKVLAISRSFLSVRMYTNPVPVVASVTLHRVGGQNEVELEIALTTDYGTAYKTRYLSSAKSIEEAVRVWSLIDWRDDGLHVGRGPYAFFMSKGELEQGGR